MRLLVLAAALAAPASVPAPSPPKPTVTPASRPALAATDCRRPDLVLTDTRGGPELKPLGELPPADLVLAVYNEENGCMKPVVVRYDVGAGGR